jgi:hypothetical protein
LPYAAVDVNMQGEKAMLRDLLFEKAGLPWVERLIINTILITSFLELPELKDCIGMSIEFLK